MKFFFILLVFCTIQAGAQTVADTVPVTIPVSKAKLDKSEQFRLFVIKSMINSIDFDKLLKAPAGFAQLVSISMVFNEKGNIDTAIIITRPNLYFELKENPISKLRKPQPMKIYANSVVVLPILYIRMGETIIDLKHSFLDGFRNLWPLDFFKINKNKSVILLEPEINPFSEIR